MINLGWGKRIAILYIGFVTLIVVMIIFSMRQKVELVSDNYYDKEIAFQHQIDEMNNANALTEKISYKISTNSFDVQLPAQFNGQAVVGQILFFRPSDASKDFQVKLKLDGNSQQQVDLKNLYKGMYKMQVSWNANNVAYFSEQTVVIP